MPLCHLVSDMYYTILTTIQCHEDITGKKHTRLTHLQTEYILFVLVNVAKLCKFVYVSSLIVS